LVALQQAAGRGRQGRGWVSSPGNFSGSTLVCLRGSDPAAPTLSLAASLALAEAVDIAVPGQPLMLKWPNDVMSGGRKLAGILLERNGDRVVVGFGVNLARAPELPDRKAADLGGKVAPEAFAPLLADCFARLLDLWRSNHGSALVRAWEHRAHLPGTMITFHAGTDQKVSGRFDGLEPDGALRLLREDGATEICRAGDVDLS